MTAPNMSLNTSTALDDYYDGDGMNYTSCPHIDMSFSLSAFTIVYAVVCIAGLLGNTLVIYVVLRFSNMQTVTNMYILNLAIADECFLIGIPFLVATLKIGHWIFGQAMCKAYMVSTSITQFTSSIFLLIMSADRYIAVCHHVSSPKYRTPFVSRVVSTIAWSACALIMLPIMLHATISERGDSGLWACAIVFPEQYGQGFSFTMYSLILGFVIPLCFIMTFYCLVIRKLRKVAKRTNKKKGKQRTHRKVTKLVLTVITVYIFCWLPYWIGQVALIMSPVDHCRTPLEVIIFLLVGCLGYSNSAINPILYAYLSDNFKKSFMKACTCAAAKDANAQLKLEHSVIASRARARLNSETTSFDVSSKNNRRLFCDEDTTATTIITNVPSNHTNETKQ